MLVWNIISFQWSNLFISSPAGMSDRCNFTTHLSTLSIEQDLYKTTRKKFTRKINRIKRSIWKVSFDYWSCLSLSYFVESSWNIFTTIVHDGSMPLNNSLDACSNNRPTLLLLSRNNFAFLLQPRIVPTANKEQERGNRETLSTLECQRDFLSCLSCMLLFNARIKLHFETRKVIDCFFFITVDFKAKNNFKSYL